MTFLASAPTSTSAAAVDAVPSPGIRRPSSRSYIGVVRPSTTFKIQMKAATLMNSGTVTKNPATKLRRSHWITRLRPAGRYRGEQRDPEEDALPRKRREPGSLDEMQERPDDERRRDGRHDDAAGDERDGDDAEALVQDASHELGQQPAGHQSGHRREADHQREMARFRPGRQPGQDGDELLAIQPHHREDRAELNHHREDAARIVITEQATADQQVRRRRDRQEFHQPLKDSEQRGFEEGGHEQARLRAEGSRLRAEAAPNLLRLQTSDFRLFALYEALALRCGFERRVGCGGAVAGAAAGACAAAR